MNIYFPKTNPVFFDSEFPTNYSQITDYRGDIAKFTQPIRDFIIPFQKGDSLQFQVNWDNRDVNINITPDIVRIEMILCDYDTHTQLETVTIKTLNQNLLTHWEYDDLTTTPAASILGYRRIFELNEQGKARGAAIISIPTENMIQNITNPFRNYYISLRFHSEVLNTDYATFYSQPFSVCDEVENTKLIEYTCDSYNYSTYFTSLFQPFQLRVPARFQSYTPTTDVVTLYNAYNGNRTLVSAVPNATEELIIGGIDGYSLPFSEVEKLNYIFLCDKKLINGKEYELVSGGISQNNTNNLYTYSVELQEKKNASEYKFSTIDLAFSYNIMQITQNKYEVTITWGGSYSIVMASPHNVTITPLAGTGTTVMTFEYPNGISDTTYTYTVKSGGSLTEVGRFQITVNTPYDISSVGFGEIGNTFVVG